MLKPVYFYHEIARFFANRWYPRGEVSLPYVKPLGGPDRIETKKVLKSLIYVWFILVFCDTFIRSGQSEERMNQ